MSNNHQFKFEFSLEVLNHLGRGLYRSFATVIAEAVSNAWDAEATQVDISINDTRLEVTDNGKGMDAGDFQNKFLKVGYSRREDKSNKSRRNVIGRKGIGKLAMLSISEKVTIVSKKSKSEITGGRINNTKLDNEIKRDGNYSLESLTAEMMENSLWHSTKETGTKIIFENIRTKLNGEDVIRKYLATQFNFLFSMKKGDSFVISVNGTPVTIEDLKELNDNTQFIWYIGRKDSRFGDRFKNIDKERVIQDAQLEFEGKSIQIKGFVASVSKSSQLLLRGSKGDFRASVNLFTNGRLRQENLFDEITRKTVTEEYLYGEIHVDGFEDNSTDRFTSSREGIIKDDPLYQKFLSAIEKILVIIIQDWTPWRNELKEEGDIDQDSRPGYEVRMEDSRNRREKDFREKINESVEDPNVKKMLKNKLRELSYKNTLVYQDLFILENIFREYIKLKDIKEEDLDEAIEEEKEIKRVINELRSARKSDEERHALKGKIVKEEHYLNYLYLFHLGDLIDCKINKVHSQKKVYRKGLELDTKEIAPVRNAVMHTVEITDDVVNWNKIKNVIDYIERLKEKIDSQKQSKKKQ
jgi:hypothetical protein